MTPATIVRKAHEDGVQLSLSASGSIKVVGGSVAVSKWLPTIRLYRDEIIAIIRCSANGHEALTARSDHDGRVILSWLARIGETDPLMMREVIDLCRTNVDARSYFVGRSANAID